MKKTSYMKVMGIILAASIMAVSTVHADNVVSKTNVESTVEASDMQNDIQKEFHFIHDPKVNAKAMEDIVENPDAIYGFSPNPESKRLGEFADYDWTDPEFVAQAKKDREAYHDSFDTMMDILHEMRDQGKSIEEMARAVSAERNRLRLASYKDDPEGLERVKQSNLETYGHEEGPAADDLYKEYGSWETVLQKSFSSNMGMDACCGLYDEYYTLYQELGLVE